VNESTASPVILGLKSIFIYQFAYQKYRSMINKFDDTSDEILKPCNVIEAAANFSEISVNNIMNIYNHLTNGSAYLII